MFKQAIHLNPNYATAHHYYSELLYILGENEEARTEINHAIELDPVFIMQLHVSYNIFMCERQFDESLETAKRMQEVIPGSYDLLFFMTYFHMGKDSLAIEALQKSMAGDTFAIKNVSKAYNKSGMDGVLNFLIGRWKTTSSRAYINIAWCYSMLKEKQSALIWLEKAMEDRNPDIIFIASNPDFEILRDEPGFVAMVEKMGLTPYNKRAQGMSQVHAQGELTCLRR
jgi:tetratricopeptide (TPR) repeat protein